MTDYVAEDGTIITEEMINRWCEDADEGFPNSVFVPLRGRDLRKLRKEHAMKPRAVRMPDSMWGQVKQAAKGMGIDPSTFVRWVLARALMEESQAPKPTAETSAQ